MRVVAALPLLLIVACAPQTDTNINNDVDIDAAAERAQSSINAYRPDTPLPANDPVGPPPSTDPMPSPTPTPNGSVPDGLEEPLAPPPPGAPGGLPDDRTPISEAPAAPDSAQGAAKVVERYYALIGERKFKPAWQMWRGGGAGSRLTPADFADSFSEFSEYHANIGAPGRVDAGAGQRFVTVPVQIYARLKRTRKPYYQIGSVTLQRSDVDGGTAAQKTWHIQQVALKPVQKR
ncbi:hypothetical protein AWL63_09610 [Sphingomonas panacis]|uniref:Lipoprotein n=1 Tax=Sphingomonas panacis TaxID=1560345 RepID=A0A1B3Z9U0_9SPHN|nr:hypothetical protein [Sphingomonas panacis]AOH84186.1 hypothetical protein AWL63_09610 [Sphingomonas panacis]